MKIKEISLNDLEQCSDLLIQAYNGEPWNNNWTTETAKKYLQEFMDSTRFIGFALLNDNNIIGAAFCHERTWWTNDELYIDELYISPNYQNQGCGKQLLQFIEQYIKDNKLAGITLLTNKYMPALKFYNKNEFTNAEHVIFMYKEI